MKVLSTIDVRLCGAVPRKDLAPCSLQEYWTQRSSHNNKLVDGLQGLLEHRAPLAEKQPLQQVFEPPSWAVAASGETRLEPIGDDCQAPVDLTSRACFRIGRSPQSDIQLLHQTSSRRHAMIFHHTNGQCYIVDCGSAHGTFVNGRRIASPSDLGVVVPHRVKRGSLVRFGGDGAPMFILKSFGALKSDDEVARNTRLNALGVVRDEPTLSCTRKRSFDSLDSRDTLDELPVKRVRCASPVMTAFEPLRLVSPQQPLRKVSFSPDPPQLFYAALVTPEALSSDDECDHH